MMFVYIEDTVANFNGGLTTMWQGQWCRDKYVTITRRIESIDTMMGCGSFTARHLISSEQSETHWSSD